jgi:TolA-binding protein
LLIGGCAASADVAGLATQDEVLRLRTDVTALQRSVQQARAQTETLSAQATGRAQDRAADGDRQTQAINQRLDSLTTTLASLTRRVEDLAIRVETLGRQMRTATAPTPRPLSTLSPSSPPAATPPAAPPPPSAGPPTAAPAKAAPATAAPATAAPATAAPASPPSAPTSTPTLARPATGALQPQDLYQAAYIDFSKGSYALAIDGFREFLRRYPDHPQANSAQYWIGECQVALAQQYTNAGQSERATEALQRAVQEFRKVVANYPRGDRTPTALYKEALTLMELKQPAVAQARLQYLVDNFPQAEETPLARERLTALKQR